MSILSRRAAVAFSLALFSLSSLAQDRTVFEERPAVLLSSDELKPDGAGRLTLPPDTTAWVQAPTAG